MSGRRLAVLLVGALVSALVFAGNAMAATLAPLSSFGSFGSAAGNLRNPGNVEVSPSGNYYVADYGNNRVDVFSPSGAFLFAFGQAVDASEGIDICDATSGCKAGGEGTGAGALNRPGDVVFHDGDVYIPEYGNNRVSVFSEAGQFLYAFGEKVNVLTGGNVCNFASGCKAGGEAGGDASMYQPYGITVANGQIYVAAGYVHRVDIFKPDGTFVGAFGKEVSKTGGDRCNPGTCEAGYAGQEAGALYTPYSIELDAKGRLLVGDFQLDRVDVYTTAGEFLFAFGLEVDPSLGASVCTRLTGCQAGESGPAAGAVDEPTMASDSVGNLYVAGGPDNRVSEFSSEGTFIRAFGEGVETGAKAFEICTTTCLKGGEEVIPGAIIGPYGLTLNAADQIVVVEDGETAMHKEDFARVEVFEGDLPAAEEPTPPGSPGGPTTPPTMTPPTTPNAPVTSGPLPSAATTPSNLFQLGKLELNKRRGAATLPVTVPGPGSLTLAGKDVKEATANATGAQTLELTIRLVGKSRKALLKRGTARVRTSVTFTPTGGTAHSESEKLTLKKTLR